MIHPINFQSGNTQDTIDFFLNNVLEIELLSPLKKINGKPGLITE